MPVDSVENVNRPLKHNAVSIFEPAIYHFYELGKLGKLHTALGVASKRFFRDALERFVALNTEVLRNKGCGALAWQTFFSFPVLIKARLGAPDGQYLRGVEETVFVLFNTASELHLCFRDTGEKTFPICPNPSKCFMLIGVRTDMQKHGVYRNSCRIHFSLFPEVGNYAPFLVYGIWLVSFEETPPRTITYLSHPVQSFKSSKNPYFD